MKKKGSISLALSLGRATQAQAPGERTQRPALATRGQRVGRKAGTAAGFEYSDAMKKSGITWDETTMTDYNRDPKAKVPGTKMVFNGVKNAGQLAELVAYLKQATQ